MTTLLITHPACLAHDMGEGHPERPDRLRAIERAFESESFQMLARDTAPRAEISAIARVHPLDYIEAIRAATPTQGLTAIDQDTSMSPGTFEAALRSAGGAVFAVDEVMTRKVRNAFVATRPPGHHAELATPMGFCFFNNAAVAARHAQAVYGAERVAIMDFDVHHGNGTQHIFWNDRNVMYASTHEMPHYPGTGSLSRAGRARPDRQRAACAPATPARPSARPWRSRSCRASTISRPISSSFQRASTRHRRDPLGNLNLVEADYVWATRKLMEIAQRRCAGRIVSVLEGGYDLDRSRPLGRRACLDADGRVSAGVKGDRRPHPSIGSTAAISMPKPERPT